MHSCGSGGALDEGHHTCRGTKPMHSCRHTSRWRRASGRAALGEIRDDLIARINEAERKGWLGEVEGLKVSLAGAGSKLAQLDRRRTSADMVIALGMPRTTSAHPKTGGGERLEQRQSRGGQQ